MKQKLVCCIIAVAGALLISATNGFSANGFDGNNVDTACAKTECFNDTACVGDPICSVEFCSDYNGKKSSCKADPGCGWVEKTESCFEIPKV
jgi:hypothetical protein